MTVLPEKHPGDWDDIPKPGINYKTSAGTTKGLLLRDERWAFIQYGEGASGGIELYDTTNDPQQFTNLAKSPAHVDVVDQFKSRLAKKLAAVRDNDLRN